jgi:hypothetical protein
MESIEKLSRKRFFEIACLLAIIVAAIVVRVRVMFGTSLIPGMNGAYYLVQTRSIIEKGSLGEHDMPLIFLLQAGLALLIKLFSHLNLDSSIFLAVKIFDSVVPALSAIPAYLIAKYLDKGKYSIWTVIASASIVTLSYGPLRMLGDFQKNALGMLWFLFLAYYLIKALSRRSPKDLLLSLLFLILCGLTHIGAFAVALVFVALVAISWAVFVSRLSKHTLIVLGCTAVGVVCLLALLMIGSDSIRISKLISYLSEPLSIFQFSNVRGMFRAESLQTSILFGAISIITVFSLIWQRHYIENWEYALIIPSLITTLFLISPFVNQDFSTRFQIMAFAPGLIAFTFLIKHSEGLLKRIFAVIVLVVVIVWIPTTAITANSPSISEASYNELVTLNSYITGPSNTLIVARHGLEWWVAWVLHTNIAQANAVSSEDWNTYDKVLYIQEVSTGIGTGPEIPSGQRVPPVNSTPPSSNQIGQPNNPMPQSGQPPQRSLPQDQVFNELAGASDTKKLFEGNYFILYDLPTPISLPNNNR